MTLHHLAITYGMEKKIERVADSKDVFIELTEGDASKSGPKGNEPSIKTK